MNFKPIQMPAPYEAVRAWRCQKGFWSFVIQTDPFYEPGSYFCTYRDMRKTSTGMITQATAEAVFFKGDKEAAHQNATDEFVFKSFTGAVEACKKKSKELGRGHDA